MTRGYVLRAVSALRATRCNLPPAAYIAGISLLSNASCALLRRQELMNVMLRRPRPMHAAHHLKLGISAASMLSVEG